MSVGYHKTIRNNQPTNQQPTIHSRQSMTTGKRKQVENAGSRPMNRHRAMLYLHSKRAKSTSKAIENIMIGQCKVFPHELQRKCETLAKENQRLKDQFKSLKDQVKSLKDQVESFEYRFERSECEIARLK